MPNNSKFWLCPECMINDAQQPNMGTGTTWPPAMHVTTNTTPTVSSEADGVTIVKTIFRDRPPHDNYEPEGKLGQYEYGLIACTNGWLGRGTHNVEENQSNHTRISEAYSWLSPTI